MRHVPAFASILALSLAWPALPAFANDPAGETATASAAVLNWPDASPSRLEVTTRSEIFDEVPITVVEFVGAGVRIHSAYNGDWICQPSPAARYSLELRNYQNSDVTVGLAVYPRAQFMADLDAATWQRYLAGLRACHGASLVSLETSSDRTYFLGRHNREVVYTVAPGPDQPARRHREIFVLAGDKVIVAAAEGPDRALAPLEPSLSQFLSRLNLEN